jgi:hypothetical protein
LMSSEGAMRRLLMVALALFAAMVSINRRS